MGRPSAIFAAAVNPFPARPKLDEHELLLAQMQFADFRSANLFRLLTHHVRPGTVLDVGCGGGGMVAWLVEHGHDARGIDLNADTVAAARHFLASRGRDPMRVSCGSPAEIIPTGLTLDNVISMDTLEHDEDDHRAFAQLVELTRPGGRLIVTVPALMALFGPRDRDMGHFRRYSRESLCELAAPHNIRIDDLRYWNLIGVAPAFVTARLLRCRIDESFRYGGDSLAKRLMRNTLSTWFRSVENRIRPPLGLTLILTATRLG